MKINEKVLKIINTVQNRVKIAYDTGVSEQAVINAINRNSDVLTKYQALKSIKEITGLTEDEIIEKESITQ